MEIVARETEWGQAALLAELKRRAWDTLRLPLGNVGANPTQVGDLWIGLWRVDGGNVLACWEECECCERLIPVHALYSLADLRTFRPSAHICADCDACRWEVWQ